MPPEEPLWAVLALEAVYVVQTLAVQDQLLRALAHSSGSRSRAAIFSQMSEVVLASSVYLEALAAAVRGVAVVAILVGIKVILASVRAAALITLVRS